MQDRNVQPLKATGYQPSAGMLDLADKLEEFAKKIREGKVIAGGLVTISATDYEVETNVNYDGRGITLYGGVGLLHRKLGNMLD